MLLSDNHFINKKINIMPTLRRHLKGASKVQGWRLVHGYKTVKRKPVTKKRKTTTKKRK